jgi:hypothetical protein
MNEVLSLGPRLRVFRFTFDLLNRRSLMAVKNVHSCVKYDGHTSRPSVARAPLPKFLAFLIKSISKSTKQQCMDIERVNINDDLDKNWLIPLVNKLVIDSEISS